jgi:hypothetical protein
MYFTLTNIHQNCFHGMLPRMIINSTQIVIHTDIPTYGLMHSDTMKMHLEEYRIFIMFFLFCYCFPCDSFCCCYIYFILLNKKQCCVITIGQEKTTTNTTTPPLGKKRQHEQNKKIALINMIIIQFHNQ